MTARSARRLRDAPAGSRLAGDPLTLRQRVMFDWIRMYVDRHGRSPTQRDLARSFGMRVGSVWCYLKGMERAGLISRPIPGAARGIALVQAAATTASAESARCSWAT